MPSHDELEEGVRARLRELFETLEATLQGADDGTGVFTGSAAVLEVLTNHLAPALNDEVRDAVPSGAATWHLASLASGVVDSVQLQGTRFRAVRNANKQLKSMLTMARIVQVREATREMEELEALVRQVPAGVQTQLQPTFDGLQTAVAQVPAGVQTQLQPTFDGLQTAVAQVPAGVQTQLQPTLDQYKSETDEKLEAIEGLLRKLPDKLSDTLIKVLPDVVRAIIIAIKTPVSVVPPPPVIQPVQFNSLQDLAAALASDYTGSTAKRIDFLQGALNVLTSSGTVPPGLIPPIDNIIVAVLNYTDPANPATFTELGLMNTLKNQIAPFLQTPVVPGAQSPVLSGLRSAVTGVK